MFIHISQTHSDVKGAYLDHRRLWESHIHGTIQLNSSSFRNCLAYPVCTANHAGDEEVSIVLATFHLDDGVPL